MNRKPLLMVALLALVALVFLGAGCGGDDDESAADTTPAETSASETTTPAASGGSPEECREFQRAASEVGEAFASATTGSGTADLEESARAFDELTDKAPSEVKADFETINTAFGKLAEALEGVDLSGNTPPDQETVARLQKVMSEIDQAKLSAASARISAWAAKNCKA